MPPIRTKFNHHNKIDVNQLRINAKNAPFNGIISDDGTISSGTPGSDAIGLQGFEIPSDYVGTINRDGGWMQGVEIMGHDFVANISTATPNARIALSERVGTVMIMWTFDPQDRRSQGIGMMTIGPFSGAGFSEGANIAKSAYPNSANCDARFTVGTYGFKIEFMYTSAGGGAPLASAKPRIWIIPMFLDS